VELLVMLCCVQVETTFIDETIFELGKDLAELKARSGNS
jgi:hypothetical protein